ncbi:MAG TPA: lipocalin family protein, partial [Thermomicrobiales bacterium]|nr:lipocalin family protein [Thermomicrobiales bacterium]
TVAPTMLDQELDTRPSTGVIYWEGEATVTGMSGGRPIDGLAYVELTGYAPVVAAGGIATPEP